MKQGSHLYRKAQPHLPNGQHHFECSENFIAACDTNEVALRANDVEALPQTMLCFAQVMWNCQDKCSQKNTLKTYKH